MIKNMTRKGLAIGSALALAVTGFVGMPANAAGTLTTPPQVTLEPTTGTQYAVIADAGRTFSLTANELNTAGSGNVKFLVADTSSALFPVETSSTGVTLANTSIPTGWTRSNGVVTVTLTSAHSMVVGTLIKVSAALTAATNPVSAGYYTVTAVDTNTLSFFDGKANETTSAVTSGAATDVKSLQSVSSGAADDTAANIVRLTDGSFVVGSGIGVTATTETLVLRTETDATVTAAVTAWKDTVVTGASQNTIDASEFVSPTRTVEFWAIDDLGFALDFKQPVLGDTSLVADLTTTPVLNFDQLAAEALWVSFTAQGSAVQSAKADATVTRPANTTVIRSTLAASTAGFGTEVIAGTYTARAHYDAATATDASAVTPASTAVVSAAVAAKAEATVAASANVEALEASGNTAETSQVRLGTASVEVAVAITDATGNPVPAGRTVTASTAGTGFKINGSAGAASAVTNANGVAVFTVSKDAANIAGTTGTIEFVSENVTAANARVILSWVAASYSLSDLGSGTFTASTDDERSIAVGGSYTFNVAVLDQWKVGPTSTVATTVRAVITGNTNATVFSTLANGRASFTVTDAQIGSNDIDVALSAGTRAANGTYTSNVSGMTITLVPGTQTGAAIAAITSAAAQDPKTIDLVAGDLRLDPNVVAVSTNGVSITQTVRDAISSAARGGVAVTVSGPSNVLFTDGANRSAFGTFTVYANNAGVFQVYAHSNIAQTDSVVTVTAQGASREVKITINAAAPASATQWVIDAPSVVQPGSAVLVTLTLKDKFGNPVTAVGPGTDAVPSVSVTYTGGLGVAIGTGVGQIAQVTDAEGKIVFQIWLGANDRGTGTITASYRKAGNTTVAADVITTTKTVSTSGSAGEARGWTRFLSATNELKIYARDVVGAGKIQFIVNDREIAWINATDANDPKLNVASDGIVRSVFVADMQAGKNVIEIYEDGVRLERRIYTK